MQPRITWRDGGEGFTFREAAAPAKGGDDALKNTWPLSVRLAGGRASTKLHRLRASKRLLGYRPRDASARR